MLSAKDHRGYVAPSKASLHTGCLQALFPLPSRSLSTNTGEDEEWTVRGLNYCADLVVGGGVMLDGDANL